MKKTKFNALIAAGCLTFLAPLSANAADDWGNLNVTSGESSQTKETADGGSTFSSITVGDSAVGTSSYNLTIDATNGTLSINDGETGDVTLNNASTIQFTDAVNQIALGDINIKGNNTITINPVTGGGTPKVDMDAINIDASAKNVSLTLDNVKTGNYDSVSVTGTKDVDITLKNASNLKNTTANSTQNIAITSQDTSATASTISLTAGTEEPDETTNLKLIAENISGTAASLNVSEVTLNNNTKLTLDNTAIDGATDGIITVDKVNVKGTSAIIQQKNTVNGSKITSIIMDNSSEASLNGVKSDAVNLNGDNTLTLSNTAIKNLVVSGTNNDFYANDAANTFENATLSAGTEENPTTLNLHAKTESGTGTYIAGETISVNGNSRVNFDGAKVDIVREDENTAYVSVKGTNNVLNNDTSNSVIVDGSLKYDEANASVTLDGPFIFNDTVINNGSVLNATSGNINIGNIKIDADNDTLVINSSNGGNVVVGSFDKSAGKTNVTFNSAENSAITKSSATSIGDGESLTLNGSGQINLGNVTVSGTAKLGGNATDATIGKLSTGANTVIDTADGTAGTLNLTEIDFGEGTSWKLDFIASDETGNSADKLVLSDAQAASIADNLSFTINPIDTKTTTAKYIKYVQLVDSDVSVLKTTGDYPSYVVSKPVDKYQYMYVHGEDGFDFAPNTVMFTNYDPASDYLLRYIILQGKREWEATEGIHYVGSAEAGLLAYPNMQARAGAENIFEASSTCSVSGFAGSSEIGQQTRAQILTVDSRDGIDRTLNWNGGSLNNALSDSSRTNPNKGINTGNGAALQVYSTDSATATVNLNPYYRQVSVQPAEGETPTDAYYKSSGYDRLNPDSYYVKEEPGVTNYVHVLKDVAFTSNEATGNGGAVYAEGTNSSITSRSIMTDETPIDDGVSFTSNIAHGNGGAMALTNGASYHAIMENDYVIPGASGEKANTTGASYMDLNTAGGEGGALYNDNATFTVDGDYTAIQNKSIGNGGAVANKNLATFMAGAKGGDVNFWRNVAGNQDMPSHGGAVYSENATTTIGSETSEIKFVGNEAFGDGGAHASVNNDLSVVGKNVTYGGTYVGEKPYTEYDRPVKGNIASGNGGAISAVDSTVTISAGNITFDGNISSEKGGAIYARGSENKGTVVNLTSTGTTTFKNNIQGAKFFNGSSEVGTTDKMCGHTLDATTGEHVHDGGEANAIYLDGNATLNLTSGGGAAKFVFDDPIAGNNTNNTINQNGVAYYNTDNSKFNGFYNLNSGEAYFTQKGSVPFMNADYRLNGGTVMHLDNNVITNIKANSLDLSGTSEKNPAMLTIDMDLSKEIADRFTVANSTSGNILVTKINQSGDTSKDEIFFDIVKQPEGSKEKVDVKSTVDSIKSPKSLYEYSVNGRPNGLLLQRVNTWDTGLFAPQIAVNARLAGQLDLYNNILHRVDEIAETRYFHKVQRTNLYAADPDVLDDSRIDNKYTPYVNQEDGGCTWLKPYATVESISPVGQDGYKNRAYNAFIGYESPVATMKNGWDLINTVFGGYQGSFQDYDNIRNFQNGGSGGYMANLYHNNFFAGGVVMMGGTNVDTVDDGKWGRNLNYGLFDIGASARVGYNIGMGKHWLFQPMLTTSYIYITGINRHNERGEDVHMKGTNTIQVAPGFKIVGNYRGWQPYVLFDYTWPIIAKTLQDVNNIDLPDVGLRSYVEYGVGLRKNMGERFMGHIEAVMRNGGRTGISFQGGLVFKF